MAKKGEVSVPLYLGLVEYRGESFVVPFMSISDAHDYNENIPISKLFEWNARNKEWSETEL